MTDISKKENKSKDRASQILDHLIHINEGMSKDDACDVAMESISQYLPMLYFLEDGSYIDWSEVKKELSVIRRATSIKSICEKIDKISAIKE